MNFSDLMAGFRALHPFKQALVVGAIFFVANTLVHTAVEGMSRDLIQESISASVLFVAVFYITSMIIMKKTKGYEARMSGPRKGLRKR